MVSTNENPNSLHNYSKEIDNILSLQKIDNAMFLCTKRDDGSSNGVIHLFNKKTSIKAKDRQLAKAVARFIGVSIQNIESKTIKITTTLAVQLDTKESELQIETTQGAIKDNADNYD